MPVFLRVCDATGRTNSITAPSLSRNAIIDATVTFRYFGYPSDDRTVTIVGSLSSRINSNVLLRWTDLPRAPGLFTTDVELRWERSVFYRFFGFGPDTSASSETSYTRLRAHANLRGGLNLGGGWNAGLAIRAHRDDVQDIGVPGLLQSRRVFPTAPGMRGATTLGESIDLVYDNRPAGDYSERGQLANFTIGAVEGVARSPSFARGHLRLTALVPQIGILSFAGRFDASYVGTGNAPFYDQSSLGGSFLLRGFTENRFVDQNAWTVEAEERVRLLRTHIYGVIADWRIDPFVGVGQVFGSLDHALSRPRPVAGAGFRAWVHPNVVGRIDVATGGEGLEVYVEIGYPY
jgi:outer membrane protein assembly factor BamA